MFAWPEPSKEFISMMDAPEQLESAWYFLIHQGDILLEFSAEGDFRPLAAGEIEPGVTGTTTHFLGMFGETGCFAIDLSEPGDREFGGLRSIFGRADNTMLALAGRAQQICEWHRTHRFCGKCGEPTRLAGNDRSMVCSSCRMTWYPRLSPSIIVLVHRDNQVLLARNHRFPEGMYSTLAGFVEPGESIRRTLSREVKEEVGVDVGNVRYLGSQPWPFPNSLMLGFHAEYTGGDIVLQEDEIEDARWFDLDDLPAIPGKVAISRWLIDAYLDERGIKIAEQDQA